MEKATLFIQGTKVTSDKWHETATSITALRWEAERLYHQQGK
jgi:hypothetical protein